MPYLDDTTARPEPAGTSVAYTTIPERTPYMAMAGFNRGAEHDGRPRLLLVDPYGGSREGLGAALRGGSLVVETAEGIAEAVAKLQDGEFDVAVIDLDLPPAHGLAEDGWDLVRIVREVHPTLPLVLIAAECHSDTQAEAVRHGAAHLLEKPINPRELRRIVQALRPETAPA